MRLDAAIIGGTGTGNRLAEMGGRPIHVPTRYGCIRGNIVEVDGRPILSLSRHSARHKVPPHLVNYRGLAEAAKSAGVRVCVSTAAVGSLRADWPAGTFALCTDFVDVSARNVTMFDASVQHTDFTFPFSARARDCIVSQAESKRIALHPNAVYINGPGPRYETPHEIQLFRKIGDLVGMTAGSEAVAMRESGIDYACLAIVTNLAAGISINQLSHEEVVDEMNRSGPQALDLLFGAIDEYLRDGGA